MQKGNGAASTWWLVGFYFVLFFNSLEFCWVGDVKIGKRKRRRRRRRQMGVRKVDGEGKAGVERVCDSDVEHNHKRARNAFGRGKEMGEREIVAFFTRQCVCPS